MSERLRHKNRAWTPWDYERLLLQQYPEIYYALCLPCTKYPASNVPGHVLVLVLPVVASPPANLPPGFTAGKLREMEAWLRDRISPTVQVAVANPAWQTVSVTVAVTFAPDQPEEVYRKQLNDELKAYLSPWVFEQTGQEAPPKVRFHPEEIRKFIRQRPYVKGLAGMSVMLSSEGADSIPMTGDDDWLSPSKPWNLLITAEQHIITQPA